MTLSDYREHLKDLTPGLKAIVGEIIEDALLTGEDRPQPEVADKLDKYIAREKYFQDFMTLAHGLKGETKP